MLSGLTRKVSLRFVFVTALTVPVVLLTACDAFGTPVTDRDPSFSSGFSRDAGVAGRGGSGGVGGFGGGGAGGDADASTKEPRSDDAGDDDAGDDDDASVCVPGNCCGLKCTPA